MNKNELRQLYFYAKSKIETRQQAIFDRREEISKCIEGGFPEHYYDSWFPILDKEEEELKFLADLLEKAKKLAEEKLNLTDLGNI
jgi:hypothetical protein